MLTNTNKIICILTLVSTTSLSAMAANTGSVPADSTQKNTRDSQMTTLTPEDQSKGSASDVELTRKIRQELVGNGNLSTYAQNVKIITLNGVVTLRGPVKTQAEKDTIASTAQKMAGVKKVNNNLEISK